MICLDLHWQCSACLSLALFRISHTAEINNKDMKTEGMGGEGSEGEGREVEEMEGDGILHAYH